MAHDVCRGRGMAVGDLFNDGKIDAVINVMDGPPALLLDVSPDKHNWIDIKLVGGPRSPRDAIGATVYLTAIRMRQRGDVISGGSYASTNDPRLHFGVGEATIHRRRRGTLAEWREGTIFRSTDRSHRHPGRGLRQKVLVGVSRIVRIAACRFPATETCGC